MRHIVGDALDDREPQLTQLISVKRPDVHHAITRLTVWRKPVIAFSKVYISLPDFVVSNFRDDSKANAPAWMSDQIVFL